MASDLSVRDQMLRAHKMTVSDLSRPLSSTSYGRAAERIIELEEENARLTALLAARTD